MYRIYTLLFALFLTTVCFGQTPVLVKDINANISDAVSGSKPDNGFVNNGKLFFAATDYQGREPWKTDGTAAGTVVVKDIVSIGSGFSSYPHGMVNFSNSTYFFTGDSSNSQLWKIGTDDTARFVLGSLTYPHDMVVAGSYIFWSGTVQGSGRGQELIKFDPTNDSLQIFDIRSGTAGSDPQYLMAKRDSVFFSADDGLNGRELWIYDPISVNKTDMVVDINSGVDPSNPYDFAIYHDSLFFSANLGGADGVEMISTDGQIGGANTGYFIINHQNAEADSSNPNHKFVFNNKLFFSATDGLSGNELWAYDGIIDANPFLFKDINTSPVTASSDPAKYGFIQAGLFMYFAANNGVAGNELWRSDGITGGTTALVQDVNAGSASSDPQNMFHLGDTVIYTATTSAGHQIWRAKFNTAALIQTIQPAASTNIPNLFASYNNKIYFGADNGTSGVELYTTNGLTAGTGLLKDIFNNGPATNSNINWLENLAGVMYFGATKNALTEANGLWKSDGTFSGTVEVVAPGGATNFSVATTPGKVAGTLLFFRGHNTAAGDELWKSSGTAVGTVLVKDINPGTNSSSIGSITPLGAKVVFLADDGTTNGYEPWVSDGSSAGTFLLKNINAIVGFGSSVQNMTVVGTKIFFTADDGINGRELWVTDGTLAGTILVKNINPSGSSNPGGLTAVGTSLYFYADDGTNGYEPWKSDGTLGGTSLIKNINPSFSSMNSGFCSFGAFAYFSADDGTGAKLWKTDGTSIGTTLFNSVASPALITNIGTKMLFFSYPSVHPYGYELYASDGVTVTKLRDFAPNSLNYLPDSISVFQAHGFGWLDDNSHGQELFSSDGSTPGSTVYDIAPGSFSSFPRNMKGISNSILYSAYDATSKGYELWKFDVGPPLPISGLEFNVSKKDNSKSLLDWKTYTEFNNKGFEVQRSTDGNNFTDSLGFVNGKVNAFTGASYEFTDATPLAGRNYYRLKQKDFDGRYSYSPIRWVDFGKSIYIRLYPNPASNVLNINSSYTFKNAQLNIRSSDGQLLKQQTLNGSGTFSIAVKNLPAGSYFIEINENTSVTKLAFTKY